MKLSIFRLLFVVAGAERLRSGVDGEHGCRPLSISIDFFRLLERGSEQSIGTRPFIGIIRVSLGTAFSCAYATSLKVQWWVRVEEMLISILSITDFLLMRQRRLVACGGVERQRASTNTQLVSLQT